MFADTEYGLVNRWSFDVREFCWFSFELANWLTSNLKPCRKQEINMRKHHLRGRGPNYPILDEIIQFDF